jgi:hypothetical protein
VVSRLPAPGARHHGPGRPPGRRGTLPPPRDVCLRRGGGARGAPSGGSCKARGGCGRPCWHGAARALQLGVLAGHREHRVGFPAGFNSGSSCAPPAQGFSVERVAQGRHAGAPPRGIPSPASPTHPGGSCGRRSAIPV